jgi:hypothetical protein
LGSWVVSRRTAFTNNKLSTDRIEQLESVKGWVWNINEADFSYGLGQLKKFVEREKHARVHARYVDDDKFTLGGWVASRRSDYKNNNLETDRIKQLETVEGWVWDTLEADFSYGLGQLKKFVKREKHALVPHAYIDDDEFTLGIWVSNRRANYRNNNIGTGRIKQLETVEGWIWHVRKKV